MAIQRMRVHMYVEREIFEFIDLERRLRESNYTITVEKVMCVWRSVQG